MFISTFSFPQSAGHEHALEWLEKVKTRTVLQRLLTLNRPLVLGWRRHPKDVPAARRAAVFSRMELELCVWYQDGWTDLKFKHFRHLDILWDNNSVWLVIIMCWQLNTYGELEILYSCFTARLAPYMYMSCLLVRIYSDWTSTPALWCNGRSSSGLGSCITICLELCLETGTQQKCTNWFSH